MKTALILVIESHPIVEALKVKFKLSFRNVREVYYFHESYLINSPDVSNLNQSI